MVLIFIYDLQSPFCWKRLIKYSITIFFALQFNCCADKGSSSEDKLQIIPEEQMSEAVYNEWDFFFSRLFSHQSDRAAQYLFCWECHLNIVWHLLPAVSYSA